MFLLEIFLALYILEHVYVIINDFKCCVISMHYFQLYLTGMFRSFIIVICTIGYIEINQKHNKIKQQ